MLGEFTRKKEPDCGLDFPRGDGRPLVVVGQTRRLGGDALEEVVDEAVHDAHGFAGDSGVGVHLLQDFVDVDSVTLLPLVPPLGLVPLADVLYGLAGFLHCLATCFGCHFETRMSSYSHQSLF